MQNKILILSTKKLLPSIIALAMEKNIEIIEKEFISIKPIQTKELNEQIKPIILNSEKLAVVFTSANAVSVIKKYLYQGDTCYIPGWNVFCIAGKTKESLHPHINSREIVGSAGSSAELAQKIIDSGIKEIIFFCGNKRRNELPDILNNAGIKVQEIVLYETVETSVISTTDFEGVLFFSPSAAKSFFSANKLSEKTACFAIGKTTESEIKKYTKNPIILSAFPSQEMMLSTVTFYFQNINCYK